MLFKPQPDGISFSAKVFPGAKKNQLGDTIKDEENQLILKIYVTAIAESGKANEAIIALLSKKWRLRKKQITIKQGLGSRLKLIHIAGNTEALLQYLQEIL